MSTTKIAFLFPGQGSQTVGMGRDLHDNFPIARAVFEEADEALGFALSKLIFEGPEDQLKLTEHTQPAILTVSVAAARVLAERGITPPSPPAIPSANTPPTSPPGPSPSPTPSAPCAPAANTCSRPSLPESAQWPRSWASPPS